VQDPGAGAHPLRQAGVDDAGMPGGILVHQRALEHPGDDLHVLVRVRLESGSRRDHVVVADQQQAVVGVQRVVVAGEREGVLGVQPRQPGLEPVTGPADIDRRRKRPGDAGHRRSCGRLR
jgi:hypothetical protein